MGWKQANGFLGKQYNNASRDAVQDRSHLIVGMENVCLCQCFMMETKIVPMEAMSVS